MTVLLVLAPVLAPTFHDPLAGPHQGAAPARDREAGGEWIYYDYLENGELRGGRLAVDDRDPLHGVTVHAPVFPPPGVTPSVTLVNNGDPDNRLDLVFVGDGYTGGELGKYANDVDDILPSLLSEPPLDIYGTYINVHRVDVVSPQSGVDNDPVQGVSKSTALDMEYWCGGTERLLCVNVGKAKAQAGFAPDHDQVLALANSTKYGGAGYSSSDLATLAGDNFSSIGIALHELGHSLGNLADEYTYGGPSTYAGGEPSGKNLSKKTSSEMLIEETKWHLWLDVPGVSTYEGGGYSVFGIYRPTNNSMMRNLGRPFEEVNSERLIVELYKVVDPIDDASPAGHYTDSDTLFVTPMAPIGHALTIQWELDGAPLAGQTGPTLDPASLGLADGLYALSVTVVDPTDLVRDPAARNTHLTETRAWTLSIGDSVPPGITSVTPAPSWANTPIDLTGVFLDEVIAARIGGEPATILAQSFDTMTLGRTTTSDPGWIDIELDTLSETTTIPAIAEMFPSLQVTTTGVGGTIDARLYVDDLWPTDYVLLYSLGTYPAPIPLPGIYYGLLADLGAFSEVITGGVFPLGPNELSFPVPNNPGLQGLTLNFQSWTHHGSWVFEVESFSNLASVTL